MGLTAVIPAWIVFFIDVIVVALAGKDIKKDTDGVISLEWGNAVRTCPLNLNRVLLVPGSDSPNLITQVWMTLGTAIALTLAMVISVLVTGQSTRRKRFVVAQVLSRCSIHLPVCVCLPVESILTNSFLLRSLRQRLP